METVSIVAGISELKPGDVITNFACRSCRNHKVLVLEQLGERTFHFSARASEIVLVEDPAGPFQWSPRASQLFVDERGEPYDHIGGDTVIMKGAGKQELEWYLGIPKASDAPYKIAMDDLVQATDPATHARLNAVMTRMANFGMEDPTRDMQAAVKLALGMDLSEQQMRNMLLVINFYSSTVQQVDERLRQKEEIFEALFASAPSGLDELMGRGGRASGRGAEEALSLALLMSMMGSMRGGRSADESGRQGKGHNAGRPNGHG